MEITPESIRDHIPYYLTSTQKDGLLKALKDFPSNTNYYLNDYHHALLQGDGWTNLHRRNFETGMLDSILGIVLSNSCDVSSDNKHDFPSRITFAPLVPLSAYVGLLHKTGISPAQIYDKVTSIKEQRVTSIFFLPAGNGLQEDHIALLDELYTMPAKAFESENRKSKVYTLSLVGFYLFIFKLSVHFCRFGENLARN